MIMKKVLLGFFLMLVLTSFVSAVDDTVIWVYQEDANSTSVQNHYIYLNYTKPINATSESKWLVKFGYHVELYDNISIPCSCWNANPDKLMLRMFSNEPSTNNFNRSYGQCWDGSQWIRITGREYAVNHTFNTSAGNVNKSGLFLDGDWDTYTFFDSNALEWRTDYNSLDSAGALIYEDAMWWAISRSYNQTITINESINFTHDYYFECGVKNAFNIINDNVTVDCKGHSIRTNPYTYEEFGYDFIAGFVPNTGAGTSQWKNNTVVQNCVIKNFQVIFGSGHEKTAKNILFDSDYGTSGRSYSYSPECLMTIVYGIFSSQDSPVNIINSTFNCVNEPYTHGGINISDSAIYIEPNEVGGCSDYLNHDNKNYFYNNVKCSGFSGRGNLSNIVIRNMPPEFQYISLGTGGASGILTNMTLDNVTAYIEDSGGGTFIDLKIFNSNITGLGARPTGNVHPFKINDSQIENSTIGRYNMSGVHNSRFKSVSWTQDVELKNMTNTDFDSNVFGDVIVNNSMTVNLNDTTAQNIILVGTDHSQVLGGYANNIYAYNSIDLFINANTMLASNIELNNVDYSEICYNTNVTHLVLDADSVGNYVCGNNYVNLTVAGDNNNFTDNTGEVVYFTPESEGNYFPLTNEQEQIIEGGDNEIETPPSEKGYVKQYNSEDLQNQTMDIIGFGLHAIMNIFSLVVVVILIVSIIKGAIRKLRGGTFFPPESKQYDPIKGE